MVRSAKPSRHSATGEPEVDLPAPGMSSIGRWYARLCDGDSSFAGYAVVRRFQPPRDRGVISRFETFAEGLTWREATALADPMPPDYLVALMPWSTQTISRRGLHARINHLGRLRQLNKQAAAAAYS